MTRWMIALAGITMTVAMGVTTAATTAASRLDATPADPTGTDVRQAPPPTRPLPAPAAHRHHHVCTHASPPRRTPQRGRRLVRVSRQVVEVDVVWLPGLNAGPHGCRAVSRLVGTRKARRLAGAIDSGSRVPPGTYDCPSDDGTGLVLYFWTIHGRRSSVDVALTGCGWLSAPGAGARYRTSQLDAALARRAPRGWLSYLR